MGKGKVRLDVLVAECGLAESREQAQRLVLAGQVTVDGAVAVKPGHKFDSGAWSVSIEDRPRAALQTACCSTARCRSLQWMLEKVSYTGNCAMIRV